MSMTVDSSSSVFCMNIYVYVMKIIFFVVGNNIINNNKNNDDNKWYIDINMEKRMLVLRIGNWKRRNIYLPKLYYILYIHIYEFVALYRTHMIFLHMYAWEEKWHELDIFIFSYISDRFLLKYIYYTYNLYYCVIYIYIKYIKYILYWCLYLNKPERLYVETFKSTWIEFSIKWNQFEALPRVRSALWRFDCIIFLYCHIYW